MRVLFIISAAFVLCATPVLALDEEAEGRILTYHDHLLKMCEKKAGKKCCRASVHAMRREQARLKPADEECPKGLHRMSLACPASFNWCSFKTVEQVRGAGARGNQLK